MLNEIRSACRYNDDAHCEVMMDIPVNTFKLALREGRPQIGLWLGLANATCAETCAVATRRL